MSRARSSGSLPIIAPGFGALAASTFPGRACAARVVEDEKLCLAEITRDSRRSAHIR